MHTNNLAGVNPVVFFFFFFTVRFHTPVSWWTEWAVEKQPTSLSVVDVLVVGFVIYPGPLLAAQGLIVLGFGCHKEHDRTLGVYNSNVLWCRAKGRRHRWIPRTPVAPALLISVCLCGDKKLLQSVDLCRPVLTAWLDGSPYWEGVGGDCLWTSWDKAPRYQACRVLRFRLIGDKYLCFH